MKIYIDLIDLSFKIPRFLFNNKNNYIWIVNLNHNLRERKIVFVIKYKIHYFSMQIRRAIFHNNNFHNNFLYVIITLILFSDHIILYNKPYYFVSSLRKNIQEKYSHWKRSTFIQIFLFIKFTYPSFSRSYHKPNFPIGPDATNARP